MGAGCNGSIENVQVLEYGRWRQMSGDRVLRTSDERARRCYQSRICHSNGHHADYREF